MYKLNVLTTANIFLNKRDIKIPIQAPSLDPLTVPHHWMDSEHEAPDVGSQITPE